MPPLNILYIGTDQWRGDAVGYTGNKSVLTPNLDQLASRSTVFERCISNSPLCVPARAAIMTGQLPRENGVWSNATAANTSGPSHVRRIRDVGYHTAVIGKTHLWRTGPGPKPGLHAKEMDHKLEAWGFDERIEVNDPIGTGSQGCAYTDFATTQGFIDQHRRYIRRWIDELRSNNPTPWAQQPSPAPEFMDIDSFIGSSAVKWLENYDSDKPFYLQAQFTGPHDPYDGPDVFRALYDNVEIDCGITNLPKNPPPRVKARTQGRGPIANATEYQRRQWRVNYYANISLIDHWIGKLVDTLALINQANSTLIMFTSDHGEMLGDLGLMGKTVFYEPSIHIPFLIYVPNQTPRSLGQIVSQLSIPLTLMDVAGVDQPLESQGDSLWTLLQSDRSSDQTSCVYSELFGETTVVTDRYKLTVTTETLEPSQLLDRQEDPEEIENFVEEPAYGSTRQELTEQFLIPLASRIDEREMARYRAYTKQFGRLN